MQQTRKSIKDLNLLDDFLFYEAVSGEKGESFCRLLIRAVCGKDVGGIWIRPQTVIQGVDTGNRGVRMDLYVDEGGKCFYDFEPDKYTSREILPVRNRYYRAMLDGRFLGAGEDFRQLPELWTIFILPHDPFGRNRMCYTVKNRILEAPDVAYEDGAVSLFLYTKGMPDGNESLFRLLRYLENSTEENATTEELAALHQYVTAIKKKKEVGVRYMKSWELERMWREEAKREGLAEGRSEGRLEGKLEGRLEGRLEGKVQSILELLESLGTIPDELKGRISREGNPGQLSSWLKLAAKSGTMDEFQKNM